jgi:hypothetical protein
VTDPRTAAQLHEAGEFHNPASCPTCRRQGPRRAFVGFDGARRHRLDVPTPVTFIADDGATTVVQADSIEWTEEEPAEAPPRYAEPFIPHELWDRCLRTDPAEELRKENPLAIEAGPADDEPPRDPFEDLREFLRGFVDGIREGFEQAAKPKPPTTGPRPRRTKNPKFH